MKKILCILSFLALICPKTALAQEPVNKFGIHILEPSDLNKAAELVNSSGGDWGWVTVVIRDNDMDFDKWQNFMNECRIRHLIPLVRLATHLDGENWLKPRIEDVNNWYNFLKSLNWPTSEQYLIIFNEPNQTKEWGGETNPKEYARILNEFMQKFHFSDSKFLILNSGFDLAASNSKTTMDSFKFTQEMNYEIPGIFEKLDGWASHSYPNHGYLGKPWEVGKTSIKGYDWELNILKNSFNLQKDLPVFITETGWPHQISNIKYQISKTGKKIYIKQKYYDEMTVADFIKYSFENVWLKDERVKAITPFVLNYPGDLFADFSWLKKNGEPSPQYAVIKNMSKTSWWPNQEEKIEVLAITVPPFLPTDTTYKGKISLKNIGQSILGEKGNIEFKASSSGELRVSDILIDNKKIKPGEILTVDYSITSLVAGDFEFGWEKIGTEKVKVFPASILSKFEYTFWQKFILKIKSLFN